MTNKITSFLVLFIVLFFCLLACKDKSQDSNKKENTIKPVQKEKNDVPKNESQDSNEKENSIKPELKQESDIPSEFKSLLKPNEKIELGKIYSDTVNYLNFNDDGDDFIFIVEKNKNTIGLVYNNREETKFVRGDKITINWKMDSIRYAGDSEFLDFTEFLISFRKIESLKLKDENIKFLWRETQYNEALKTDINTIILNEEYIKNISEPEKAALAYVATFIGNECEWDGEVTDDRSNLKCKILWALDLGYQCSHKHLDYLRLWFRSDEKVLKELKRCPTKPDGATIQSTFSEIDLEVKDNEIIISFKASGINLREGESWTWNEKHFFEFKKNELIIAKKEISPKEFNTLELQEN